MNSPFLTPTLPPQSLPLVSLSTRQARLGPRRRCRGYCSQGTRARARTRKRPRAGSCAGQAVSNNTQFAVSRAPCTRSRQEKRGFLGESEKPYECARARLCARTRSRVALCPSPPPTSPSRAVDREDRFEHACGRCPSSNLLQLEARSTVLTSHSSDRETMRMAFIFNFVFIVDKGSDVRNTRLHGLLIKTGCITR